MSYSSNSTPVFNSHKKVFRSEGVNQDVLDSTNNHKTPPSTQSVPSKESVGEWSLTAAELINTLPRVWTRELLYLLVIFTSILLPWSMLSKVDETGSARGRLEPKGNTVELDAPVTGTVAAINVEEGQSVKAGQILLELDSELIGTELQEFQGKLEGQVNRLAQLELLQNQLLLAVRTQKRHNQAQELEKQVKVKQAQQEFELLKATYNLQKGEKQAQVEQARQAIAASEAAYQLAKIRLEGNQEKVPRYRKVFEEGAISKERFLEAVQSERESRENMVKAQFEVAQAQFHLREQQSSYQKIIHQAQSDIEQAQLRLQEQQRSYQSLVHSGKLALLKSEEQLKNVETQITTLKAEIAQSESKISSLEFQLKQRVFRSPIDGKIFQLPLAEAGEVVQPGELVAQIAPQGTTLVLRAEMPSQESGFLQMGMPVKIKFDAYPFQDYGVVEGNLHWISPDSKVEETQQGKVETFEIEVVLDQPYIETSTGQIAFTPGQTATAEVIVRQRRVIDFILEPFQKLQKGGLEL